MPGDRHVIGHNVDQLAQFQIRQFAAESIECLFAAEFLVDAGMIDDVIAMRASRSSLQVWRAVQMIDSERLKIGGKFPSGIEPKLGIHLHAIRR